ncbi:MAG: hypothetical protein EA400_01825 [Chromatiaceae bacterium]|nr:MAG: hypothetical protein EA400_01825 [Chromatiaceae bacterium]
METPRPTPPLLPRPRMALRLGFAGRRDLSADDEARLGRALDRVLGSLGRRLAALVPVAAESDASIAPGILHCYDPDQPPLLRLVTGLCEGADTAAVLALERLQIGPAIAAAAWPRPGGLETELAAVLPWDLEGYRASRYGWFQAEFDRQAAACRYLIELDGSDDRSEPDTVLAAARRAKGYRAQSALLLRQADLLLAAADPRLPGKAGGTLETLRAALAMGLPVIFIDIGDAAIRLMSPDADLDSVLALPPPPDADLDRDLDRLVERIIAAPHLAATGPDTAPGAAGLALLQTFFSAAEPPAPDRQGRGDRWRLGAWAAVQRRLERAEQVAVRGASAASDDPVAAAFDESTSPYHGWHERARLLARHYRGLDRGGLVLGYGLAVLAVLLATLGLVLFGAAGAALTALPRAPGQLLLLLACGQFAAAWFIVDHRQRADRGHWRALAAGYQDLAERLRALYYLPLAGSFQPPAALPAASHAGCRGAVDWLSGALARAVSPTVFARPEMRRGWDGAPLQVHLVRSHPRLTLAVVRDHWVRGELIEAVRQTRLLRRLEGFAARGARRFGRVLVAIVALELLIIAWTLAGTMPAAVAPRVQLAAPWLLVLAAVLPAAVAALHGLRGESQGRALAEHAEQRQRALAGEAVDPATGSSEPTGGHWQALSALLARSDTGDTDLGAWSLDALLASERVARDCQRGSTG